MKKTQVVDGIEMYVVDLDEVPEPNTWGVGVEQHYAAALNAAIRDGLITEPGKYGIHIDFKGDWNWTAYKLTD